MQMLKKLASLAGAGIVALWLFAAPALAQSSPNLIKGQTPTAAQWNSYFAAKQDVLGYTPLNVAGGVMSGRLVTAAPGATTAGLNLTPGSTPASPVNGDLWVTSSGIFARINGSTVALTGGSGASFAGTSPINVTFPAGVVTYAFDFTIANTFLAQQIAQGATTTSPGWYAQIAGDTTPRVRVGMNATDVPSVAFGPGNAVRDAFIERAGVANIRFGAPDAASPVAQTIGVQNVATGTSNTAAGTTLIIADARGTGTGAGGNIALQVAPAGGSGTSQNALVSAVTIFGTGGVNVGSPTGGDKGAGSLNAQALYVNNAAVVTGTPVGAGTINQLAWYAATGSAVSGLATANSGVLVTSAGGVPSISTTLPSGIAATNMNLTTPSLGVATGTSLALGGCTIGGSVFCASGTIVIASNNSVAFNVGPNGGTNPAFTIDASAGSLVAGLKLTGAATGGTVALAAIDSGSNTNVTFNAKGTGTVNIGGVSTGAVSIGGGGGGLTVTNSFTATGLVTYADMASAAIATGANYLSGASNVLVPASAIYQAETTTTFGATTTFDFNTFINTAETLTGNVTTQTLSNVTAGKAGSIRFIQDGTGSRTSVFNTIFKFNGGTIPTLTLTANAVDVLNYNCVSTTYCQASLNKDVRNP